MNRLFLAAILIAFGNIAFAQSYDKSNTFVYNIYNYYGSTPDTSTVTLHRVGDAVYQESNAPDADAIPGLSVDRTIADYAIDTLFYEVAYPGETFLAAIPIDPRSIQWDSTPLTRNRMKFVCSINSNRFEFVVDTTARHIVTPLPNYGRLKGVLLEFWRNGQLHTQLASHRRTKAMPAPPSTNAIRISARELNNIKTQHLVQTTRIFDDVQLSWGKTNATVNGELPADTVLHFAGGTLALRRISLPQLPAHYQHYLELHQYSNGDAYDRTGSVFVIPHRLQKTFLDGVTAHPDSLPIFVDRRGNRYQGIARTENYEPIVELMRFFTSFGVRHFNDRVKIDGLEWRDENYYKQDVTDLSDMLAGDVWIGIWIGNYDGGGHRVTLDLKSYAGDYALGTVAPRHRDVIPLFTTTNVLEMAGQNYGQLFLTDSLTTTFTIADSAAHAKLRFITTGHGGWGGGDEFNQKPNTIILDGKEVISYTPWRCDCGRYREWNPVSGNSWDGQTSSDYSRSGWCPGTATQPLYVDLGTLAPGKHTITVAIPQGEPAGNSISHWCVTGQLLVD